MICHLSFIQISARGFIFLITTVIVLPLYESYEGSDHAFGTFIKAQEIKKIKTSAYIAGLSVRRSDKFSC